MHKISGTYCASLTPVNEDYSINKKLFLSHCQNLLSQNIDGLAIFGTTGEANSFNVDEKIEALQFLIENNINVKDLIPGTGQCSIQDTVRLTKTCSSLNVKAVLVLPPFYYKNVTDEGIINYFRRVVEEVNDNNLKYILYNIPKVSGVSISFDMIEKLIRLFPNNIVGMKDSSDDLDNMLKVTKYFNNFSLFSGSDSLALKVCKHGGAGAITATANISGKLLSFIVKNCHNNLEIENFDLLQDLQERIRETLFSHEQISALKAYLSIQEKNDEWNRVNPPLQKILNPSSHKTIIGLIQLLKTMDELIPPS